MRERRLGKKAEAFATDEHGKRQKQKHLPRINTELHGRKTYLSEPDA